MTSFQQSNHTDFDSITPTQLFSYNFTPKTPNKKELYTTSVLKAKKKVTKAYDNDVIFEKGRRIHRHPGNIHYRNILRGNELGYHATTKRIIKDTIAHSIYNQVSGRFLTRMNDGTYEIVSQENVILKIKQAFRDRKKSTRPSRKQRKASPTARISKKNKGIGEKDIKKEAESQFNPIPLNKPSLSNQEKMDTDFLMVLDIIDEREMVYSKQDRLDFALDF